MTKKLGNQKNSMKIQWKKSLVYINSDKKFDLILHWFWDDEEKSFYIFSNELRSAVSYELWDVESIS